MAILFGLLLAAAGCGGSEDPNPRKPARDLSNTERKGIDTATKAQIERFAKVVIPASATNLHSLSRSALDSQLLVSFRLPAADLDAFVRSGSFRRTLTDGDRAIGASTGSELGWHVDRAKRVKGLADVRPGLGRNLVVVLDEPRQPVVYLEAATL